MLVPGVSESRFAYSAALRALRDQARAARIHSRIRTATRMPSLAPLPQPMWWMQRGSHHGPGSTNTSMQSQIAAAKRALQGTVLYVTTFFTQKAGSDPSGPQVAAATKMVADWNMRLDVHVVSQAIPFNDDFRADGGDADSQATTLRQVAAAAYDDGGNPARFPVIFTPLVGRFRTDLPVPQQSDPLEVGETFKNLGWLPFAIINSNTTNWTPDNATMIHEMGHAAGLNHVWTEAYPDANPPFAGNASNAVNLMCADGPRNARALDIQSSAKLSKAYYAKKP
jgi:hypothetical protein